MERTASSTEKMESQEDNKSDDSAPHEPTQDQSNIKANEPKLYELPDDYSSREQMFDMAHCLSLCISPEIGPHETAMTLLDTDRGITEQCSQIPDATEAEIAEAMHGFYSSQIVAEWQCPDDQCRAIGRTIERRPILLLQPPGVQAEPVVEDREQRLNPPQLSSTTSLQHLLQGRLIESIPDGIDCPCDFTHQPRANTKYRRLKTPPEYLIISLNRHPRDPVLARLDPPGIVRIPEFLDINDYHKHVALPSDQIKDASLPQLSDSNIYRLEGVYVFTPPDYYVSYITKDNHWFALDKRKHPIWRPRHPQAAINAGHIPFYVVYARQTDRSTLPLGVAGSKTEGFVLKLGSADPGPAVISYAKEEADEGGQLQNQRLRGLIWQLSGRGAAKDVER